MSSLITRGRAFVLFCVGLCIFIFLRLFLGDNSIPVLMESKETPKGDPQEAVDLQQVQVIEEKLDDAKQEDDHRFCRTPTIGTTQDRLGEPIPLRYQCKGIAYDNFGIEMMEYVRVQQVASNVSTLWGRRPYPVPANKTILVIGNSHTRQTFNSMMCQYADKLVSIDNPCDFAVIFHFHNHGVIILSTNSPLMYSHSWFELLTKTCLLGKKETNNSIIFEMYKLDDFDAVVVGKFNGFSPINATNFVKSMLNYTTTIPGVNFVNIPGPSVEDVVQLFPNHTAVVGVTMFAVYGQKGVRESTLLAIQKHKEQSNIVYLNGRKHIDGIGIECGSDGLGLCQNPGDGIEGREPKNMHRCTGEHGGHADLLAWDVIETLYTLLE
jgi:hypothetical protein